MTGWYILGGFLAYWYLLRKGTTRSLVEAIRNELTDFSRLNAAGIPEGTVGDTGAHESAPGSCDTPLGITPAEPSGGLWPQPPVYRRYPYRPYPGGFPVM